MADQPLPNEPDEPAHGVTEELVAYLDGELDLKAAESLATRLSLDPKLRAQADALQRTWDILDILPRPQPTSAFASRTVSQVIPVPTSTGTQIVPFSGSALSKMALPAARPGPAFWVFSTAAILIAAAAGYFGRQALMPAQPRLEPTVEDYQLMKNLRLYRNVEDMDYLKRLDSPETFGDESE